MALAPYLFLRPVYHRLHVYDLWQLECQDTERGLGSCGCGAARKQRETPHVQVPNFEAKDVAQIVISGVTFQ